MSGDYQFYVGIDWATQSHWDIRFNRYSNVTLAGNVAQIAFGEGRLRFNR